ncbi:MAG: protease [Firmicutes bacterium HGW-Firmicutes-3]|jgi:protease I|nr:MAG: protease [Firmicutes bacterium HGW-Firmicutes-3]
MKLKNKRVLAFVDTDFEDLELWYPIYRLREEGAVVFLAGEKKGETYIGKYGVPATSDMDFTEAMAMEFDALLVPGGWAPDKLRRFDEVLSITKRMDQEKKVIGEICHAGWVLISADILKGKKVTSTPGIKHDMMNAGATWLDEPSVVDGHLISARRPPDLPDYMRDFIKVLSEQ